MPKISIVIPTYNSEKIIYHTINSVLNQSFKDFELIIIDNASTDGTVALIEKYTDKRITVIKNSKNIGLISNWNKALSYVTGEYFKLLPDDDILEINALEEQTKILEYHRDVVLVGCQRNIINEKNKKLLTIGSSVHSLPICTKQELIKSTFCLGTNKIGEPGSVLIRSNVLNYVNTFDDQFIHFIDLHFYLKVLQYGNYYFINKPLYNFRVWSRSYSLESQNTHQNESDQFFSMMYKHYAFLTFLDLIKNKINRLKSRYLKKIFYFYIKHY